jgi:Holliday junction resolvase RusA-like endonuclease
MIELRLPVNPVPCPRPRMTRSGRTYYPRKYNKFKKEVATVLPGCLFDAGLHRKLEGPLLVKVALLVQRPKQTKLRYPSPDIDNYCKSVLDALNGYAWTDDTQVVELEATKSWNDPGESGEIQVIIEPLHD